MQTVPSEETAPVPEIWQRFPKAQGWRILYTTRDNQRKLLTTYVQNKNGFVAPFHQGMKESAVAASMAVAAASAAAWALFGANMATLKGVVRKAVFSAAIKLVLILARVRKKIQVRTLRQIQVRVMELIGTRAPQILVNLIDREIKLQEQVEFEGGKAVIKKESAGLMEQIKVAILSIVITCSEFKVCGTRGEGGLEFKH
jgi:hypothetical protein